MSITEKKMGFFGRLSQKITDVIMARTKIDDDMIDDLEEVLITSDIGMDTTVRIMDELRDIVNKKEITEPSYVTRELKRIVAELIDKGDRMKMSEEYPLVILMIGINGGGKTTTIAKMGNMYRKQGKSVMFCAADTFRAAAGE